MAEVRIYTLPTCPYCANAKQLLTNYGARFEEIDVTVERNKPMRSYLLMTTGRKTFPQIFINDMHVGGFSDLEALDAAGQLAPMLR